MYHVTLTPGAEADLACLDKPITRRVLKKLRWLAENFEITEFGRPVPESKGQLPHAIST